MLTKKQINNFLKLRNNENELNNIVNVITLSLVKYYNDQNIITMIDNFKFKESKTIKTIKVKNNIITVNSNLTKLNKIEYILEQLNYYYINNSSELEGLNQVLNILQIEDIIKTLFKIVRLNNITYLDELSNINNRSYKCLINQVETNLIRPLYNFYKKKNKEFVKKDILNILNNDEISNIDNLLKETKEYKKSDFLSVSESYRKIKEIINKITKEAE